MKDKKEKLLSNFWKKNSTIIIASVFVTIIFLIFIRYLSEAGWLTLTGNEHNTTIVAASIALIGALFGAIVSLLGLALKHSVDQRNLTIQERNQALAKDAEQRLKNEASIQSIGLLSTSAGGETSKTQRAGVILALANLDKYAIALSLADQMMNDTEKPLDTGTFCWLINKAIKTGENDIKLQALLSLSQHVKKLPKEDGTPYFAVTIMDLNKYKERPIKIRQTSIEILIDLLTYQSLEKWRPSIMRNIINTLYRMYKIEKEESTKKFIGTMLLPLLKVRSDEDLVLYNENHVTIKDIATELFSYKESTSNSNSFTTGNNRLEIVKKWSKDNAYR